MRCGETALQKQLNHPFYRDAEDFRAEIKMETLKKAAQKYPEPFDPSKWTIEQLAKHAMAENYDQQNYIFGMFVRLQTLQKEKEMHRNDVLKFEAEEDRLIDFLNDKANLKKYEGQKVVDIAIKLIGSLQSEAEYWRLRCINPNKEKGQVIDERI